ncbi:MAG: TolC family protein, partial [Tannerella sp.]|nr:TolC family protein [Tannerella sp.]
MNTKRVIQMTAFTLLCIPTVFSQQAREHAPLLLSLNDCVHRAVEMNINVSQAALSREKSAHKTAETFANLLPQVEAGGAFQDNMLMAVNMLPGEIFGKPGTTIPVKFGTKFTASATVSANMVLYNQTVLTALKRSKKGEFAATLGVEKAQEEIAKEVAKLYFLIQTSAEQKQLIQDNIARTEQMTHIVKTQVDNGLGRQVDYDRIMVSLQNLQTQWDNTEALYQQQANMMKYMLEMPSETVIVLTDSVNTSLLADFPIANADFSKHIDIRLLEAQKEVAALNQKMVNHGYYPTLSAFGQYGYQGLRQNFGDYFNDSPNNKWYASSYIGLRLTIPVFDGFRKRSQFRQADVETRRATSLLDNTKERFSTNYKTALTNYFNNQMTVERQQNNTNLAEKIYCETSLKYREGMATMSDLLQDEMGLNNAQANYLNALYKFK